MTVISICACMATAQAQSTLLSRVDSLLEARNDKHFTRYDTAYIGKPNGRWTVKLRTDASGTDLYTKGTIGGSAFKSSLKAEMKSTVGVTLSYRGVSLGYSVNPAKLAGRNKDNELTFSTYGNRVGFDLAYTSANTFSGEAEHGEDKYDIGQGSVEMEMLQANAYYAFNYRRFSFPAAFSQSQVQKRSCGSWLLGLSAFAGRINAEANAIHGIGATRLSSINVAVGGGYAYNFVIKRKWLLHISAMPHVVVFSRNKLTVGGTRQRTPYRFPSLINIGRLAAVRNFKNSFMGMSAVVNLWQQGDSGKMMIESLKWRARLFYGFRF